MENSGEQRRDTYFGTKAWSDLSIADQDRYILACIAGCPRATMLALDLKNWQATALVKRIGLPEAQCEGEAELCDRERFVRGRLDSTQLGDRIQRAFDRRDGRVVTGLEPDPFDIKVPEANLTSAKPPSLPATILVEEKNQPPPSRENNYLGCLTWVPFLALPVGVTIWGIDSGDLRSGSSVAMAPFRFLLLALMAFLLAIGVSDPLRKRGVPGPARWVLIYLMYVVLFFVAALLVGLEGAYPDRSLPSNTRP